MESRLCYCWDCHAISRAERKRVNTALHLVLALFTAGVWLLVFALCHLIREPWRCVDCGGTLVERGTRAALEDLALDEQAHAEEARWR